jgi:hypothetical protein
MIPLGGKIRQPAGEIVSAFEDLRMVQYRCGAVSAASVGRSAVVMLSSGSPICGGRYRCAIPPPHTLIILHVNLESKRLLNTATQDLKQLIRRIKNDHVQFFLQDLQPTAAADYSLWKATKTFKRITQHSANGVKLREA